MFLRRPVAPSRKEVLAVAGGHSDDDKTQAVTVLSKGTVINHYRIVEKIGAGGMGGSV